jgi:hypothetical protein
MLRQTMQIDIVQPIMPGVSVQGPSPWPMPMPQQSFATSSALAPGGPAGLANIRNNSPTKEQLRERLYEAQVENQRIRQVAQDQFDVQKGQFQQVAHQYDQTARQVAQHYEQTARDVTQVEVARVEVEVRGQLTHELGQAQAVVNRTAARLDEANQRLQNETDEAKENKRKLIDEADEILRRRHVEFATQESHEVAQRTDAVTVEARDYIAEQQQEAQQRLNNVHATALSELWSKDEEIRNLQACLHSVEQEFRRNTIERNRKDQTDGAACNAHMDRELGEMQSWLAQKDMALLEMHQQREQSNQHHQIAIQSQQENEHLK